ncbi:hypothetical protein QE454_000754 [Microbacterium sp. SORGH_AS454]|nr:hypothetical protein [Microbacterium sp. SORGH_AS_0454]
MFWSMKVSASCSEMAPSSTHESIRSRRSSSMGSGRGGEGAISTMPRSPKRGASPRSTRAATRAAILPPMLWPPSIHGPFACSERCRMTWSTVSSSVASGALAAEPKPGRSMPCTRTSPASSSARRSKDPELAPSACSRYRVRGAPSVAGADSVGMHSRSLTRGAAEGRLRNGTICASTATGRSAVRGPRTELLRSGSPRRVVRGRHPVCEVGPRGPQEIRTRRSPRPHAAGRGDRGARVTA